MIILNNLWQYVIEQDRISNIRTADKWQRLPYEIDDFSGEMLLAGECTEPEKLTLKVGVSGWHRIYICFVNMRSDNYAYFRLSDEEGYCGIKNIALGSPRTWCNTEFAQEIFWKCADMTGRDIIIDKPRDTQKNAVCIAWIKFEPMTEAEVEGYREYRNGKNKCMHFHFDEDRNLEDTVDCTDALIAQEAQLAGTDVGACSFEISFDYDGIEDKTYVPIRQIDRLWNRKDVAFSVSKEEAYRKRIDTLHKAGIKAFAANRMGVCSFHTPYDLKSWNSAFADTHPEYYCLMRDGSRANICSYAYPEVRRHIIDVYKKYMDYGFDGATLIFIRGMLIGFEAPVTERFSELYPDVDPFTLPMDDKRLNGVWCSFVTEFMRELRKELPGAVINVVSDYAPETARRVGVDIETWAREGLVDGVIQGHMEIYEDLEGCLAQDGTIVLEDYVRLNRKKQIIRRIHGNAPDKVIDGVGKYKKICDEYGIDFYGVMSWPRLITYDKYPEYAQKMRSAGAEKFFCWNSNQVVWNLPELHTASMLGHDSLFVEELSRYYKVISIDNNNIASYNPNWKG